MPLWRLTLQDAVKGISARKFSCVEYAAALLDRADELAHLNAFVARDDARLLAAARRMDEMLAKGEAPLPLHGTPIAIKDNIDTLELPTTACTGGLAGRYPLRSAPVVTRLQAAGALVAGKTNMHELAFGITNNNAVTGPARNPHDPQRIPGGSSGGSAVAVASCMTPVAIGTDTGASVRLPAALCGIVGFRPTAGRYPAGGIVPISRTRDTPGPMARSVGDIQLLDCILAGERGETPERATLRDVRLGRPAQFWHGLDPAIEAVMEQAMAQLRASGVTIVDVDDPSLMALSLEAAHGISRYEFVRDLRSYLADNRYDLTMEDIVDGIGSPDVAAIVRSILGAGAVREPDYLAAMEKRNLLRTRYSALFHMHRLDALVFPTSILAASRIGEDETVELNGARVPTFSTFNRNTAPGSIGGIPGISIPAGLTRDGLPVGIELDAAAGNDQRLLEMARLVMERLPERCA